MQRALSSVTNREPRRLLDRAANLGEGAAGLEAQRASADDDGDCDKSRSHAVLDGGCTSLVIPELFQHGFPPLAAF